nr:HAMP domain-containing sensor histidine kinase [uncultured Anaerostipes sp.]
MQHTILADQEQRTKNEKARTDMAAGISHDLRTPLTSVQGYIKGVLDGVADTPDRKNMYLKTAYESTEEMNVLFQKLFDFSRMESGQMPFHMVSVDLGEFTVSCVAQKEAVMDPENAEFTMEQDPAWIPEVMLDVDQVRRIFDNLLENSLKYAMVRPVRIQIRLS